MPMTLLYPHRQHLSRRLQVFADWLEAVLEPDLFSSDLQRSASNIRMAWDTRLD